MKPLTREEVMGFPGSERFLALFDRAEVAERGCASLRAELEAAREQLATALEQSALAHDKKDAEQEAARDELAAMAKAAAERSAYFRGELAKCQRERDEARAQVAALTSNVRSSR